MASPRERDQRIRNIVAGIGQKPQPRNFDGYIPHRRDAAIQPDNPQGVQNPYYMRHNVLESVLGQPINRAAETTIEDIRRAHLLGLI